MNLQLCWFRSDLRIDDNTALIQSLNKGPSVAIYIATPRQWREHDDAPIKIDFWRRNLEFLKQSLEEKNIPLRFFQVDSYSQIPALLNELISVWNVSGIHCNAEYPINETKRDEAVKALCEQEEINFHCYEDQCLLPPEFALTGEGRPFKVFTPYAKKTRMLLEASGPIKSFGLNLDASKNSTFFTPSFPELEPTNKQMDLDKIDWPKSESWWQQQWPAGENEATKRLDEFVGSNINHYKERRDFPAQSGTSSLSPYLASGVISVRTCWEKAGSLGNNEAVYTWKNELLWRDFYKYVMVHFPHVCTNKAWNPKYDSIAWRYDEEEFARWTRGQTGFPLVDAAMRQLLERGWMHNRLRMVVAMFLSKNLLIDWRWGERWFMQHLIDGDFSANNGGWQWSASTGTDAAPYFRMFSPIRQSERFDPDGEFIKTFVKELRSERPKTIHDPAKLESEYYQPVVDLKYSKERVLAAFKQ